VNDKIDANVPLRVVLLTRLLDYGGAERQLVALATGLHGRAEFDVSVVVFYSGGPLESELREAGVRCESPNKCGRWDIVRFLFGLVRILRRNRPDVLYSFLDTPNVLSALLKSVVGRPRVVWGIRSSFVDWSQYDWLARGTFRFSRYLSRLASRIVVNSEAGRRHYLAHGYADARLCVIPNGIDTHRFVPDQANRALQRERLHITSDIVLIGIVGRLDAMKDHPGFVTAAGIVARRDDKLRFIVVGDGPERYRDELKAQAAACGVSGRIVWLPAGNDMVAIYNALDILALTSIGEGFPNVVGEAMACGIPCVVTDVGDAAQIVGETGTVVPPSDPETMASALIALTERLADERESLAQQTRSRIVVQFDHNRFVERSAELLCSICKRSSGAQ